MRPAHQGGRDEDGESMRPAHQGGRDEDGESMRPAHQGGRDEDGESMRPASGGDADVVGGVVGQSLTVFVVAHGRFQVFVTQVGLDLLRFGAAFD